MSAGGCQERRDYVFEGLDAFVAEVLIYGKSFTSFSVSFHLTQGFCCTGLRWISRYNENGIQRMQRNIFALQQYFAG